MQQPLRFGVGTFAFAHLVEAGQYAEQLDFDGFWVADHFASPSAPTLPLRETWTMLAALAVQTTRIRIGTLVTNVALRHPVLLAKQAITLDHLSAGRLELGLGAGHGEIEHHWLGIEFLTPAERVARFREAVEIVDACLGGEAVTYHGRYYQIHDAPVYPRPVQCPRPPLTLAAQGRKALRLVAEYADRWVVLGERGVSQAEALMAIRRRNEQIDTYCSQVGRDPHTISRAILAGWAGETPFASLDAFHEFVGLYRQAGIDYFLFYMFDDVIGQYEAYRRMHALGCMADRQTLERVAWEAIPKIRGETVARDAGISDTL